MGSEVSHVEIRPLAVPVQKPLAGGRPSVGVRSPHQPPVGDGYVGSAAAPSGPAAAAEAPPARMSRARRLALAGLAALSLGGGLIGGLAAQHGVGLTQAVSADDAVQKMSAPQMVDRMIDAGRNGREVPENLRQAVHARLDSLPVDVLRTVAAHGTKIAIMRDSETPADVGVIKELPADRFADTDRLATIAERAFSEAGAKHGPRIEALEARLAALKQSARELYAKHPEQAPRPQGLGGMMAAMQLGGDVSSFDPGVQKAAAELARARAERAGEAWKAISKESDHRLQAFSVEAPPQMAAVMSMMPFSVEGIAAAHGARTPQEVKQFSDLMLKLNGPRLDRAQDQYEAQTRAAFEAARATAAQRLGSGAPSPGEGAVSGGMSGGMMGGLMGGMMAPNPPQQPLTITQRPFMPAEADVVVPNLYFHRSTGDPAQKPLRLDWHDAHSLDSWASGQTAGQYWYQPDRKTIVLREREVLDDMPEMSTTVHEFGHAYQAALEARDPAFYRGFNQKWGKAFEADTEALGKGPTRFPSGYAATNEGEFFAESFAAHFGTKQAALEARDPHAASLMKEALDDAPSAAHPKRAWF